MKLSPVDLIDDADTSCLTSVIRAVFNLGGESWLSRPTSGLAVQSQLKLAKLDHPESRCPEPGTWGFLSIAGDGACPTGGRGVARAAQITRRCSRGAGVESPL